MAQNKFQPCRLCGTATPAVINIKFKAVPICEGCCAAVFIQQAQWYTEQDYSHLYKARLPEAEKAVFDMIGEKGDGTYELCQIQTPVSGTKGYSGKFAIVKVDSRGKITHEVANPPKITLGIIKALTKHGLIREYNTNTSGRGVIYTHYKRA